jgi:nucleoside-diphosphate-sugar epimerase
LDRLVDLSATPHLLAHLAFVTREQVGQQEAGAYESSNEAIRSAVLDHLRRGQAEGMFIPSSGAVYDREGRVEADPATNPYGSLKLRDEERFGSEQRCPDRTAIVRVFNLAGPFLNKTGLYALGSIITDLAGGGPVRLRADHPVIRSYVHVADLVEIAFAVMLGAVTGPRTPFDTAGEREIEIGELATLTTNLVGLPGAQIERPPFAAGAIDRYVGDGTSMRGLAAECGRKLSTLDEQILDTVEYLWSKRPSDSPNLPGR